MRSVECDELKSQTSAVGCEAAAGSEGCAVGCEAAAGSEGCEVGTRIPPATPLRLAQSITLAARRIAMSHLCRITTLILTVGASEQAGVGF